MAVLDFCMASAFSFVLLRAGRASLSRAQRLRILTADASRADGRITPVLGRACCQRACAARGA
eukprot:2527687-Pyramimonas_sp.AAC.1